MNREPETIELELLPDDVLASEILLGNHDAFEVLVNRYQRPVYRLAYRMLGQREEAEDAVQEVFITIFRKIDQYNPSFRFSPWLYKIAANTCISRIRKTKKVVLVDFENPESRSIEFEHADVPDPLLNLERAELARVIWEACAEIPEAYKIVLMLRYQMDLSNKEIAECLNTSRENIEVKLHRARKALRKILADRFQEGGADLGL
ncbi:MAG: sigma-70 family RNA polymerase sigma factor [Solirubrobacterales bacterium]